MLFLRLASFGFAGRLGYFFLVFGFCFLVLLWLFLRLFVLRLSHFGLGLVNHFLLFPGVYLFWIGLLIAIAFGLRLLIKLSF